MGTVSQIISECNELFDEEDRRSALFNVKAEKESFTEEQNARFKKEHEARMSELYNEFLANRRNEKGYLTREQKISLMRDTLTVEQGSGFSTSSVLPSFYAQDLVMFGVKRNYPEA